jgi:hypothetical protein
VRKLLGGWGLDTILLIRSALPINVTYTRTLEGGPVALRPDYVSGPAYLADENVPGGKRINAEAVPGVANRRGPFVIPVEARQGSLGRNAIRGFGMQQVNLSVRRTIAFAEQWRLEIRGEGYNLLNRALLADPASSLGSVNAAGTPSFAPLFGISSQMLGRSLGGLNTLYQVGGPRSVQLALRLSF